MKLMANPHHEKTKMTNKNTTSHESPSQENTTVITTTNGGMKVTKANKKKMKMKGPTMSTRILCYHLPSTLQPVMI